MLALHHVFITGGIFCSFITGFILFFGRDGSVKHANRLLGVVLFALGWYALIYLLSVTRLITEVPYLYRLGTPLYYLVPPFCFLYVRSLLKGERSFRKADLLHFIPAIWAFVDLIPFYFSDPEMKMQAVKAIVADLNNSYQVASGFVSSKLHFRLRPIQGLVYLPFQWFLLLSVLKRKDYKGFEKYIGWLVFFTILGTLLYVGLSAVTLKGYLNLSAPVSLFRESHVSLIFMSFVFFCISAFLFFKPEILYGTPANSIPDGAQKRQTEEAQPPEPDTSAQAKSMISDKLVKVYAEKMDHYIRQNEWFRNQGISVNELAVILEISPRTLSYIIKKYHNQRFTDFINAYRVNYIIGRFKTADWKEMTMEGLASEAGFSSRSTFFTAFKKYTGQSPTEYLHVLREAAIA